MDQKTPMAFQDQCWKAGAEGCRNWRWINLLHCELPPPSFCPDWTILLDAFFLLKIERGLGVTGFSTSVLQVSLDLNICRVSLVPLGLKVWGWAMPVGRWHLRLLCRNADACPGLVGVVGEGVGAGGDSSTCGVVTCLTLQAWCLHPFGTGNLPDLGLLTAETPFGALLCVFRHMNQSQTTHDCLDFIVCRAAVYTPNLRLGLPHTHFFLSLYK